MRKTLEVLAVPLIVMVAVMAFSIYSGVATLLLWVVPAWIACDVALKKDRGRWWGFWLGWIGVVVAAALGPGRSREMNELETRALQLQIRELEQRLAAPEQ